VVQGVFFAGLRDNQRMNGETGYVWQEVLQEEARGFKRTIRSFAGHSPGTILPIAKPRDMGISTNLAEIASSSTISRYPGKPSCSNRCCIA